VLLVDDSAFFRNMLQPILQAAGCVVTVAESGAEVLSIVEGGRSFDAVVSDLEMPDMDGFALARALRDNPKTAAVPLIALSSHAAPGLIDRVTSAGFKSFVAKFDRSGLVDALRAARGEWHKAA
jgi:two-component system chemotaxis sensor kinase CheA